MVSPWKLKKNPPRGSRDIMLTDKCCAGSFAAGSVQFAALPAGGVACLPLPSRWTWRHPGWRWCSGSSSSETQWGGDPGRTASCVVCHGCFLSLVDEHLFTFLKGTDFYLTELRSNQRLGLHWRANVVLNPISKDFKFLNSFLVRLRPNGPNRRPENGTKTSRNQNRLAAVTAGGRCLMRIRNRIRAAAEPEAPGSGPAWGGGLQKPRSTVRFRQPARYFRQVHLKRRRICLFCRKYTKSERLCWTSWN